MNYFMTLYRYELKKLMRRKLVWITLFICVLGIFVTVFSGLFGSYYVDGVLTDTHYHMYQVDNEYRKALSGREIDQKLLEETVFAYGMIPPEADRYTLTDEYQNYARPYSDIFNLIRSWSDINISSIRRWEPSEEALYQARYEQREATWQSFLLSDREKAFWQEKEAKLNLPFTYFYHEGYEILLNAFLTLGVQMLLFVSICLPNVFSEEHTRRTDQLMLSSAKGKNTAYWAKLAAGTTLAVFGSILMTALTFGLSLGFYGAEGFQTPLQIYADCSYPLTMGQACLIAYGILIVASILMSVFVMFLSEALHSGIATLAISTGLIIAGNIIMIPDEYRFIAQLWDCLPISFLATWNIFSARPITVFGHCAASWQFVPIVYILCSAVIAVAGRRVFERYQVTGR